MNSNITGPDKLDDEHIFQVHEFCLKCKKLNYVNNDSMKAMKWEEADWFAHFIDDKIVSLSGVHKFLDGFEERERARSNKNYIDTDAEQEVQNKYSDVADKWNKVH